MSSTQQKQTQTIKDQKINYVDLTEQFLQDKQVQKPLKENHSNNFSIRQHTQYSGGFKIPEQTLSHSKYKQPEKKAEQKIQQNTLTKKSDIYKQLGIEFEEEKEEKQQEDEEIKKREFVNYNEKFGIKKDAFHSTETQEIKSQITNKLLNEIDDKIDKIHKKREILEQRQQNYIYEKKRHEQGIPAYLENQLTEKQKEALYKNTDKPIDELIEKEWKNQNPNIDTVEDILQKHREKMKELEDLYHKTRGNNDKNFNYNIQEVPIYMQDDVLSHLVEGKIDLDELDKKSFKTLNENIIKQARYNQNDLNVQEQENNDIPQANKFTAEETKAIEDKKAQTLFNEKQRKIQQLKQEIQQINSLLEQQPEKRQKKFINPTEQVIKNTTFIPLEQKIYQQQFEEYIVDKQIKEQTNSYFRQMEKPGFDKYKNSQQFEKYKKLHPEQNFQQSFVISDRPIQLKSNFQQIQDEKQEAHLQQYAEQIEKGATNPNENKVKDLYKKIIQDSKKAQFQRKKKDDEFILKFLFKQIDKQQTGIISQQEIFDNISENKDAVIYFDLCTKTLFADLNKIETSRKGLFNLQEFSQFILQQSEMSKQTLQLERDRLKKAYAEETGKSYQQKEKNQPLNNDELFEKLDTDPQHTYGLCVLNEAQIDGLREIFIDLDKHNDCIVKRSEFITLILENVRVQRILKYPAVKLPIVNRIITLEQILEQIQKEEKNNQAKEYISWNEFFDYFKNYQKPDFKIEAKQQSRNKSSEDQIYDIDQNYLILLQDIFDMIPRVSQKLDFVFTTDFVIQCKKDPQIRSIENEIARLPSKETNLGKETISEVLDRILVEASEYTEWDDIQPFFSQRGRPQQFDSQENNKKQTEKIIKKEIKNKQKSKVIEENLDDSLERPKIQNNIYQKKQTNEYVEDEEEQEDYQDENYNYEQLYKLGKPKRNSKNDQLDEDPQKAINEYYNKKRIINPNTVNEDEKIQEDINDFDKHYQELLKRQKEAQLGPLQSLQYNQFNQEIVNDDPIQQGELKRTTVNYDKYFSQVMKEKIINPKDKINITLPKPFNFTSKENREQSITLRKKQEDLQKYMQRDEVELKKQFRANEVPTCIKVPQFNNIVEKNKEKREKVKEEVVKITLQNQKPFSFYDKDIQKREEKKQKIQEEVQSQLELQKQKRFKAKEIPPTSKMEILKQKEQEEEEKRKERIEQRKQDQLKSVKEFSRLAGAGDKWKEALEKRQNQKTWEEEKCTFAPSINKEIPITSKRQAQVNLQAVNAFTSLIQKAPLTEPKPFNFQQPVPKQAVKDDLDLQNQINKVDRGKMSNVMQRLTQKKQKEPEIKEQEEEQQQEIKEDEQEQENKQEEEEQQQEEEQKQQSKEIYDTEENQQGEQNVKPSSKADISQKNNQEKKQSTKAEQLLMQQREKERKKKEEEELKKKKEQEQREKKLKDRAGEIQEKFGTKKTKQQLEEEEKQKKKEAALKSKQEREEYEQQLQQMNEKIKKRNLLTENKTHGSSNVNKYRKMNVNQAPQDEPNQEQEQQQQNNEEEENNQIIKKNNIDQKPNKLIDTPQKSQKHEKSDNYDFDEEIQEEENNNENPNFDEISNISN